VSRSSLAIIAASALGGTILLGSPCFAQASTPVKPASPETVNDLTLAAAINVCELAVSSKVSVQSSTLSTAKSITYLLTSRYGGQIGTSPKLQPEQIVNGIIIQTLIQVKQGCYDKLNAADKKFVDDVIADWEKQVKAQGQKQ
jgi:hypothetical protein